ncbi:MAG: sialate O-acetylesterase [Emticicia sp.]|nr:sialate O-acetylesterase [Emticicia sp.]
MTSNKKNTRHQVSKTSHRSNILGVFFFLFSINSIAQINVIFDSFPAPAQLIQRDDFNKAIVAISGKVYTENQTEVALLIYKNKTLFYYQKQKIQYAPVAEQTVATFSFSPIINAELSEYDFKFYSFQNKDSVLVKDANEVVCGDNILIYGQSNALAADSEELAKFKDEFRYGRSTFADFVKNEYTWVITKQWNFWTAGLLGLEIQRQLIDKYKVPIGIINGSVGNKSIEELSVRDEANHDNPSTIYGRMLKRAKGFGLDKNVKMVVWRQGESEALDPFYKNDYDKKFEKFRRQLYEDYPALKKIYTFQNNIYFGDNLSAGNLRDYQRTINKLYNDCEVMTTFGTVAFDGLHYGIEGHVENGTNIARLIARDFHKSTDTAEITAPNIKSAYFSAKNDSLILEFDKNQKLTFPKDEPKKDASHPSINIKDYIYLDGKAGNIESGTAIENHIILKLKTPVDAQKITYTPDNYTYDFIAVLPGITQIKNSRGIQALTFKDFEINKSNNIQISSLTGEWDTVSNKKIVLNWQTPIHLNYTYIIEKAQFQPNIFYEIGTSNTTTFIDNKVKKGIKYYYRIKIKENNTSSAYSNTVEVIYQISSENQATELTNEDLLLFPNPVVKNNILNLSPLFDTPIIHLRITNLAGKVLYDKPNTSENIILPTIDFGQGLYIIEAVLEDNTKLIKKFVVQ